MLVMSSDVGAGRCHGWVRVEVRVRVRVNRRMAWRVMLKVRARVRVRDGGVGSDTGSMPRPNLKECVRRLSGRWCWWTPWILDLGADATIEGPRSRVRG